MEASREELARFFSTVLPHLNEVQRRVVTGAMSVALGRGGKSVGAEASGMSRNTVTKAELSQAALRVRLGGRPGLRSHCQSNFRMASAIQSGPDPTRIKGCGNRGLSVRSW